MSSPMDEKPVRINLDDLMALGPGGKRRPQPTSEERISALEGRVSFLQFAGGLMLGTVLVSGLAEKLVSQLFPERANEKANPELPVAAPMASKPAGESAQWRNNFKHLISAPVNDQHVPEALLDESKYPHGGKANP